MSKAIFSTVAKGAKSGTQVAAQSGSKASLWYSSLLRLSDNLESFLMSFKPGFIDITLKKPTCYKDALLAELKQFKNKRQVFGSDTFLINSKAIKHFLTRHHPNFWEGRAADTQTFLPAKMQVSDIIDMIKRVLNENRDVLIQNGTNSTFQVKSKINGITYVVGSRNGRIGQFYIEG